MLRGKHVTTLVVLLVLAACAPQDDVVKIGAIMPLTGPVAAQYGAPIQNGIDLAVEEVNEDGGVDGRNVVVVYEDSAAQPKTGATGFRKLVEVDKVNVVIGDVASSVTLALAPIAEENRVVLFSPASSNPRIKDAGEFVFRNWPSDSLQAKYLGKLARDLGYEKMATFYVTNDYGTGLRDAFRETFEELGGEIVAEEAMDQDGSDFRIQLTKVQGMDFDAFFIPGYPADTGVVVRQARELGFTQPVLAPEVADGPDFSDQAGTAKEGVIYAKPKDTVSPVFKEKYEEKYGDLELFAAEGYDALWMIVRTMRVGAATGDEIRESLYDVGNGYHGASGIITFDEYGEITRDYDAWVWRDSERVPLTP